jgi:hypothetical protein
MGFEFTGTHSAVRDSLLAGLTVISIIAFFSGTNVAVSAIILTSTGVSQMLYESLGQIYDLTGVSQTCLVLDVSCELEELAHLGTGLESQLDQVSSLDSIVYRFLPRNRLYEFVCLL